MSTKLVAVDVDPERGVMLRLDFTHMQIHWTASFPFLIPHTEAHVRYDLVFFLCTIRSDGLHMYDTILRLILVLFVRYQSRHHPYYDT